MPSVKVITMYSERVAVILAGGKSTRMRKDKRFIEVDGVSLINRSIQLVKKISGIKKENVLISGDVPGFSSIADTEFKGLGPLSGLRSVVHHFLDSIDPKDILFLPVDMPALKVCDLDMLFEKAKIKSNTVCRFKESEMPFVLQTTRESRFELIEIIDSLLSDIDPSKRSVNRFQNTVGFCELDISQGSVKSLLNLNYPEDLEKFKKECLL